MLQVLGIALMNLLLNPISIIVAASPFIINSIDSRRQRAALENARKQQQLKDATELIDDISVNASKLTYLCKQAMFGVVFRGLTVDVMGTAAPDDVAMWEAFRASLLEWSSFMLSRLSELRTTFDVSLSTEFTELDFAINLIASMVEAAFFKRITSKYYIEESKGISGSMSLGKSTYLIDLFLITKAQAPNLLEYLETACKGCREVKPALRSDYRCKFLPVWQFSTMAVFTFSRNAFAALRAQMKTDNGTLEVE
jgi:hypothetical protein